MTQLSDIFSVELLDEMINERYVNRRLHNTLPIAILNYGEKAQFDNVWNDVTLNCRGLIYDTNTLEILARPWKKFFNLGDSKAAWLDFNAPVEITDKMDGSLGILYPRGDGTYAISTRGSLHSEQAEHGTRVWTEEYSDYVFLTEGYTYLFEIIYPENRIVLDYGGKDELVLLGCVRTDTGHVYGPQVASGLLGWPGEVTEVMPETTITAMLGAPDRPDTEGYVIRQGDKLVKWKRPDYIDLHRLISNLSEKSVWSGLSQGKTPSDICEDLPDEFHGFVKETSAKFIKEFELTKARVEKEFLKITASLEKGFDRRAFAMVASKSDNRAYMFGLLDGKPVDDAIWKSLKPVGETYVQKVDIDNE